MKPRPPQIHPDGATDRQVITYDAAAGYPHFMDPFAAYTCRATFVATGGETVLFLGVTPVASSEQVFVNGLLKVWGGVNYTLTGPTITFASPLSPSDRVVVSYLTTSACGIASLDVKPTGFNRPVPLSRPVRRFHRIR